jgi:hypothetical protein
MGARNLVGNRNRVFIPAHHATQPGGIGPLESISGLLKSPKTPAQERFAPFTYKPPMEHIYSIFSPRQTILLKKRNEAAYFKFVYHK